MDFSQQFSVEIYFMAQHQIFMSDFRQRVTRNKFTDNFNALLESLITKLNSTQVHWVELPKKLTLSPDGNSLLTPDGTHMMWVPSTKSKDNLPLAPTHIGLLNSIFHHYCSRKISLTDYFKTENLCCASENNHCGRITD